MILCSDSSIQGSCYLRSAPFTLIAHKIEYYIISLYSSLLIYSFCETIWGSQKKNIETIYDRSTWSFRTRKLRATQNWVIGLSVYIQKLVIHTRTPLAEENSWLIIIDSYINFDIVILPIFWTLLIYVIWVWKLSTCMWSDVTYNEDWNKEEKHMKEFII